MWARERGRVRKLSQNGHFQSFFSKIGAKTPSHKSATMEAINSTSFLPCIDSSNGLPKLNVVERTVFESMARGGGGGLFSHLRKRYGYRYLHAERE